MFQFYNLIPNLTAYENVDMARKISKSSIKTEDALAAVGLSHRMKNFPSQMSEVNYKGYLSPEHCVKSQIIVM